MEKKYGGTDMKRILSGIVAGLMTVGVLAGAAACGKAPKADKNAPAFKDPAATLSVDATVDKNKSVRKVSDELFGVFLEDINYASYALDDNLVVNNSFESLSNSDKKYGWSTVGGATLNVQNSAGIFEAGSAYRTQGVNSNYAQVIVPSAGGGISNKGYTDQEVPMAVTAGVNYVFSAFIKAQAASKMNVKVTDGTTAYLTGEINVLQDTDWVKYTRTFTASATGSSNLKLELTFDTAGTYYLDAVTLETTDSTLGIKNYIYEAIKDLSPKFIRFPGGCVIEGTSETEAYDWKNSIGAVQTGTNAGDDTVPAFSYKVNTDGTTKQGEPTYGEPATRKPNVDIWHGAGIAYYDMEYAIGFYEYFLLCESLGASAVPVLNCGLSDQGGLAYKQAAHALKGRHNKYIQDYIQDAIDLIEFAKGDTSTTWGKIRADLGHPDPFEMNYLGIGNEQSENPDAKYFTGYYEKFLEDANFKAALAQYHVETIVGNATQFTDCENSDGNGKIGTAQQQAINYRNSGKIENLSEYGVHDQHYYVNYTKLFKNTEMYEGYATGGEDFYKVFVGEYSANTSAPGFSEDNNQWITAISEAAMMTAYEKSGPVVVLAAYAPMFAPVKESARHWGTNMMYFTNTKLVRSTNYYVQQLFMQNLGSWLPATNPRLTYHTGGSTYELTGMIGYSTEINRLYYVVSVTEEGDVIVKVVNPTESAIKLNIELDNMKMSGIAEVTVLQNDTASAKNTLDNIDDPAISPEKYTIGKFTKGTIGYEAPKCSVTAIRVKAK